MINQQITCLGKNINIRSLKESDEAIFSEWHELEEQTRYFPNVNFLSEIKNKSWISSKLKDKKGVYFMIIDANKNSNIGITILENIDHNKLIASWGIYIAKKQFMKKEYVFEASNLVLNYAFSNLRLEKIHGCSLANNIQGRNFHKRLGFIEEAVFNNQIMIDDYYVDLIWISLCYEDFMNSESYKNYYIK